MRRSSNWLGRWGAAVKVVDGRYGFLVDGNLGLVSPVNQEAGEEIEELNVSYVVRDAAGVELAAGIVSMLPLTDAG